MTSDIDILLLLGIAYFTVCIISIVSLLLFFSNRDINREIKISILIYLLVYGGLNSAFEIFKHRNAPNYGVTVGSAIGGTLGFIAGCHLGYQTCILAGSDLTEMSPTTSAITLMSGVFCLQIGSIFGNVLLPI